MQFPIYTVDTIDQNAISFRYQIATKSKLIYALILLMILAVVISLPFINLKISINTKGIIESSTEKTQLLAPVNGKLLQMSLKDNQAVKIGDTLLVFDASLPKKQENLLQNQKQTLLDLLHDVHLLLAKKPSMGSLQLLTGQYQTSWQQYQQELQNSGLAKDQAELTFKRYEKLYASKVLTEAEFEKYKFDYKQAEYNYNLVFRRYQSQLEVDARAYEKEIKQLNAEQADTKDQSQKYVLLAPTNGSVQNLSGMQIGGYVFANQRVADISPNTGLLAFCYIKPADIGLIHKGQDVRFQVDAFNYNQWGLLHGRVLDISDDIIIGSDNQPVFKVKCLMSNNFLALKNGYKGIIKKGMTFTARLNVTERSLFQLLYDKIDDWINPNKA